LHKACWQSAMAEQMPVYSGVPTAEHTSPTEGMVGIEVSVGIEVDVAEPKLPSVVSVPNEVAKPLVVEKGVSVLVEFQSVLLVEFDVALLVMFVVMFHEGGSVVTSVVEEELSDSNEEAVVPDSLEPVQDVLGTEPEAELALTTLDGPEVEPGIAVALPEVARKLPPEVVLPAEVVVAEAEPGAAVAELVLGAADADPVAFIATVVEPPLGPDVVEPWAVEEVLALGASVVSSFGPDAGAVTAEEPLGMAVVAEVALGMVEVGGSLLVEPTLGVDVADDGDAAVLEVLGARTVDEALVAPSGETMVPPALDARVVDVTPEVAVVDGATLADVVLGSVTVVGADVAGEAVVALEVTATALVVSVNAGTESAKPGCEMSVVRAGMAPDVHTQSGSPSSTPLATPSPSVSAWHSSVVQVCPAAAKARPNGLRAVPPPGVTCPTPGHGTPLRTTFAPLGMAC